MRHVKTYRYGANGWFPTLAAILFFSMTVFLAVAIFRKPIPRLVPLDLVLGRRLKPVLACAMLGFIFMFIARQSFSRATLFLDKDRIVLPTGSYLRHRVVMNYVSIVGLTVKRVSAPQYPAYRMILRISHRIGNHHKTYVVLRSYFQSWDEFDEMCACLSDNVRQANPEFAKDPYAADLVPSSRSTRC